MLTKTAACAVLLQYVAYYFFSATFIAIYKAGVGLVFGCAY